MHVALKSGPISVDPVKFEVIRTGLQAIPDLIETDLMRTAFSPLIYEYKDYSVGMVDVEGRAITMARQGNPGLQMLMGCAIRDGVETYGLERIEAGDVIVSNYAGTMGQHLNNAIMYTPVFAGETVIAFFAINVHWIDIGGRVPGSCWGTDTTELIQEGLQLRSVKLLKRGEPVEELYRVIEYNSRQSEALLGDISAQLAGCLRGRALFEQLLARHGEAAVLSTIEEIWRSSAEAARAAVRAVPEGTYRMHCFMDDDGVDLGKPINIDVAIHIKDGEFIVDYSNVADEVRGPFNSGFEGGAVNSAQIAFKYLFSPLEPSNEGSFAPLRVVIPPGKFLSASTKAPLGLYQTPLSTVVDALIAAMAEVLPDRVAAGHFGAAGLYGFSGPRDSRYFAFIDTCHGGWGGSTHGDGVGPYKTIRHADNKDIPVETIEALYPLMVDRFEWCQDSAGPGRFRGGLGINKTFRVLAPCNFNLAFDRNECPPWGLCGGMPGQPQTATIEFADGTRKSIRKTAGVPLQTGDRVHIHTGAGGGYGSPLERPAELVAEDVLRGYVSREQARDAYGVVVDTGHRIDAAATARQRASLRIYGSTRRPLDEPVNPTGD
jgi:N-methylhydantoinase B